MLLASALKRQAEDEKIGRELYGENEDAPIAAEYELVLNARDRERCGERLLTSVRERLGADYAELTDKLRLWDGVGNVDGGLILRCGHIEINCSLRALFDQIRPELEAKVSHRLFPDKKGN